MLHTCHAIHRNVRAAALLVFGIGVAAAISAHVPIDGAVVAFGRLVVEGNVKRIQHPSGGVIGEIRVQEGAHVSAGDLLIRLDETVTRASLDIVLNALRAERARLGRLEALRDGTKDVVFPADLIGDASGTGILAGEARLATALLTAQEDQKRGLLERIEQMRQETKGFQEQQKAYVGQLEITQTDLTDLRPLYERGNIQRPRISALQREVFRNQGAIGDTLAKIAQTKAKIAETELRIAQDGHDFIAGIVKELRETETRIAELQEKRVAAEDQMRRLDIRAPISGAVHQLAVHTIGGVLAPSDVLMLIVPSADRLIVEIRLKPSDIDQISVGQEARVRFSASGRRTADELRGELSRVAADLTVDAQTGLPYYSASARIEESELAKLGKFKLIPGMPAEILITSDQRTLASYIIKPLRDQMRRALREP
jgi:HlyD family secretion protein